MNTDTSVPGVNRENVYRLRVLSFSHEVISKLTESDSIIRAKIFCTNSENKALAQLSDTLLPKLFSGEIYLSGVPID